MNISNQYYNSAYNNCEILYAILVHKHALLFKRTNTVI